MWKMKTKAFSYQAEEEGWKQRNKICADKKKLHADTKGKNITMTY